MLPNLEIREFRTFRHLRIERLGRVNLIVGKNNVGKTTLLEALRLYAHRASARVLEEMLSSRDEVRRDTVQRLRREEPAPLAYEHLFHGRGRLTSDTVPIRIGPIGIEDETLSISFALYIEREVGNGIVRQILPPGPAIDLTDQRPALTIHFGKTAMANLFLDQDLHNEYRYYPGARPSDVEAERESPCIYRPAQGLESSQVGELWDKIALTDLEEEALSSLRIIAPELKRINLVADPRNGQDRIFVVRMHGAPEPVSLRSMGDGMNRVLGIVLALVNAKDGMLLVDEFENGIHYSVQPEIWRLIFEVAHRLNVQVFASSHSWDSIEAFQVAAQENREEEGEVIRLEREEDEVSAVVFDEREVGIAARDQIEVR